MPLPRAVLTPLPQPGIAMFVHESIVVQMWIQSINAVDLLCLARTESFVRIKTKDMFKKPLPAQNLVQARNATGILMGGIEKSAVRVGDLNTAFQKLIGYTIPAANLLPALVQELDCVLRPDGPMP